MCVQAGSAAGIRIKLVPTALAKTDFTKSVANLNGLVWELDMRKRVGSGQLTGIKI